MAGAGVLTAGGLLAALWLGSWAFDVHRRLQHEGRLERLLAKKPVLDLVVQALEEEGTPLVARADTEAELRAVADRFAGAQAAEVLDKGGRFGHTRVFRSGDRLYFIYFDRDEVMSGFTLHEPLKQEPKSPRSGP
jgi:hypothetical protein